MANLRKKEKRRNIKIKKKEKKSKEIKERLFGYKYDILNDSLIY